MTKKQITLNAEPRQVTGKGIAELREQGKIPAVLYGHKIDNQNLTLNQTEFGKVLEQAGESTLLDLQIGKNEAIKVLIHDFQRDPVSHQIIHADLYQVNMKEKVKTEVELEFINEAPAVKNLSGVLVKTLDKVEIECLPGDLISHVDVDLSKLETFDDIIRVKDLQVPETSHVLNDPEDAVALVEEPRKIEEEKPVEAEEGTAEEGGTEGEEKPAEEGKPAEGGEEKPAADENK